MSSATTYIENALTAEPLREPVLRAVIGSLQLGPGSKGLDAGCGIGLQARLLADAVGLNGRITGIDIDSSQVAFAQDYAQREGYADRVSFCPGDVSRLPFADDTFDWVWSADCIGYPVAELAPLLQELIRVVKPGGSVNILAWSSQQLLPGYPFLEARLNATCSAYLPYMRGTDPELNFLRAPRWFREAGLAEVQAQTFAGDVQAPLSSGERAALISVFEMLWGERQPEVSADDWEAYRRLCVPGSPDFILDIPDYYAFFTYTLVRGKVPDPLIS